MLKLKSDYLAIATLGFAEIIRAIVQLEALAPVTNGSQLLRGFPYFTNVTAPFIIVGICIAIIVLLINSTYGRAFKAIRDDEIAAEAMYPGGLEIGDEEKKQVLEVLDTKYLFRYYGPAGVESKVRLFENAFKKEMGAKYALATSSCTGALISSLVACGIGPGDEVIVTGYTFFASCAAIVAAKAIPVIAEIDETLTIDAADIEKKITPATKGIVCVHMSLFGKSYGCGITGEVYKGGKRIDTSTVPKAIDNGVAYLTEDRKTYGLVLMDSISQNISMTIQAVDNAALAPVVGEAADAGIIVVDHYGFADDLGISDKIYKVLFGQKESGIMEAEEYVKECGDSGKVAIIAGLTGADNAMQHPVLKAIYNVKLLNMIPLTFLFFIALAVLMEFVLRRTQYGRNLYLVGGNINAADNLGIKSGLYIWSAYAIQGLFAAIAGVAMMTRQFSASGNLALQGPMNVIPMKSFYAREEIFALMVREQLRFLTEHGYRLVVILNGHGAWGQRTSLDRLAIEFSHETASRVIVCFPDINGPDEQVDFGHGTMAETSIMSFVSFSFLFLFLPAVLFCYYAVPRRYPAARNAVLLAGSFLFVFFAQPAGVPALLLAAAALYFLGRGIGRARTPRRRRGLLIAGTALFLAALCVFKYTAFFVRNFNALFGTALTAPKLTAPFGVSFFTFLAIAYLADVYHGRCEAENNFARLTLYLSLFPKYSQGPLTRYPAMPTRS